jgi:hypothetical protein
MVGVPARQSAVTERRPYRERLDKVEAAYRRGEMLAKRHRLMADWQSFCAGK